MATLADACTANATALTLAATDDLPRGPQFYVDVEGERMRVLEIAGAVYGVIRGTPSAAHPAGAVVVYIDPAETPAAAALRGRLTAYLADIDPTAAESVTAIKDLIRAVRYLARP